MMKRNKLLLSLIVVVISVFGLGCSNYLDIKPTDIKSGDEVWTNREQTEDFLYNIYTYIPDYRMNKGYGFTGISDELDYPWEVLPTPAINRGNWDVESNFQNRWGEYYEAIRNTFVFVNNVDRNENITDVLITQFKAEAKFLRGYFYSLLLKQYGPVPLIKKERPASANWNIPRAPYDSVVSYIVKMMDEAAKDLPNRWQNSDPKWVGKPDKLICKAVKADILVFAASPQWNGNSMYSNFKNKEGVLLAHTTYDASRWKIAVEANRDVIELAEKVGVHLYRNNVDGGDDTFNPYKSVRDLYFSWNPEIIWGISRYEDTYSSFVNDLEVYASPGPNNLGGSGPTQRIVDAFFMKNGKWITDPTSGYKEMGFASSGGEHYKPAGLDVIADREEILDSIINGDSWGYWPGDWNMYANRGARFYADILYNHRIIPQLPPSAADRNYYSSGSQKDGYGRVELYYGGKSRQSGSYLNYSKTGYLQLKRINPHDNMRRRYYSAQNRPRIRIRYAKVLLDYIECLNEVNPNDPDIAKYWNDIRNRAGIPDIFDVYPDIQGDKDKQRTHILRERQIELCFEESFDRYYTMRRRLLAGMPDNGSRWRKYGAGGDMYGLDVNAGNPDTNNFLYTGFYDVKPFETRVWDDKMYLFPIPRSEIEKNKGMAQNPGW